MLHKYTRPRKNMKFWNPTEILDRYCFNNFSVPGQNNRTLTFPVLLANNCLQISSANLRDCKSFWWDNMKMGKKIWKYAPVPVVTLPYFRYIFAISHLPTKGITLSIYCYCIRFSSPYKISSCQIVGTSLYLLDPAIRCLSLLRLQKKSTVPRMTLTEVSNFDLLQL